MTKDVKEMTEQEIRARILLLGFGGDERLFMAFRKRLQADLPEGTGVALRGSVVTNKRWEDGRPFDADARGTSDLDVTLVGNKVMEYWDKDAFYIPGLHTKPLCDEDPGIAIGLDKLRKDLQKLVGRAVNFQATANLVLYARFLHPDVKGYTFPTWEPHVRLDYVFVPKIFANRLKYCEVISQPVEVAIASDHFPLLVHLEISES